MVKAKRGGRERQGGSIDDDGKVAQHPGGRSIGPNGDRCSSGRSGERKAIKRIGRVDRDDEIALRGERAEGSLVGHRLEQLSVGKSVT